MISTILKVLAISTILSSVLYTLFIISISTLGKIKETIDRNRL